MSSGRERRSFIIAAGLLAGGAILALTQKVKQETEEVQNTLDFSLTPKQLDPETQITGWTGEDLKIGPDGELIIRVTSDTSVENSPRTLTASWNGLSGEIILPETNDAQTYQVTVSGEKFFKSDLIGDYSRLDETFGLAVGERALGIFTNSTEK